LPAETASADGKSMTGAPAVHWRPLGVFWAVILLVLAAGGATLQWLGPPKPAPRVVATGPPARLDVLAARARPGRATSGPVAAPDMALMDQATPPATLGPPRIGPDGRAPMQAYAAGFDPTTKTPRIGLVLAGIGPDAAASTAAIQSLPAAVTLAVSPYATSDAVLDAARQAGHEFVRSLPMEPQGYPQNDPGAQALLTSASPAENGRRLVWALSRVAGYVGVTGAFGKLRGERFAGVADQLDPVLADLARRGLLYVDARPGAARLPSVWSCDIDVVVDDPPAADAIDARLAELEKRAHDTGMAIGLVSAPHPLTLAQLKAWAGNLPARGAVLAPVSALVTRPKASP
jgi:polysaccharide deacetylase 2 family uncharacterized protein YibQ